MDKALSIQIAHLFMEEINGLKYLYAEQFSGLLSAVNHKYKLALSEELVEGLKTSVYAYFFVDGDEELEWISEKLQLWFENLKVEQFEMFEYHDKKFDIHFTKDGKLLIPKGGIFYNPR